MQGQHRNDPENLEIKDSIASMCMDNSVSPLLEWLSFRNNDSLYDLNEIPQDPVITLDTRIKTTPTTLNAPKSPKNADSLPLYTRHLL